MPDVLDHMFCSQQIIIPPNLPTILKKYAKAAIRTQPKDLLIWSASYFKALTYGIPLPVKDRLEYPPVQTISGLTPGYLKVLINQLGNGLAKVSRSEVTDYWNGVCLSKEALEEIFAVGGFGLQLNWLKFIAICAGYLENNLTRTMTLLCELLTEEPAGGSAHIPIYKFLYLYKYLARLECGPDDPTKSTITPPFQRLLLDENSIDDTLSGEGICYKGEEEKSDKSISAISWQSVLKRMGKMHSDVSVSTMDHDLECNKHDYLSRGIEWKRIADIGESEPDTSQRSESEVCDDSSLGLQVFEYDDDKIKNKRIIYQKDKQQQKSRDISIHVGRTTAKIDLTENLSEKSKAEIRGLVQEFQTTIKIKETGRTIESGQYEVLPETPPEENIRSESIPSPLSIEGSDIEIETEKTKHKLNILVRPDSSMILVPTPPKFSDEEVILDIQPVEDEEKLSTGEPMGLKRGTVSLFDVRVPYIKTPKLINLDEEDIPRIFVQEQKWVHIPGIGPKVSEQQIKQVENFMKECANKQGGAVMPRNIRHFQCPPLDPLSYIPG